MFGAEDSAACTSTSGPCPVHVLNFGFGFTSSFQTHAIPSPCSYYLLSFAVRPSCHSRTFRFLVLCSMPPRSFAVLIPALICSVLCAIIFYLLCSHHRLFSTGCRDVLRLQLLQGIPTVIGEWSLTVSSSNDHQYKDAGFLQGFWAQQLSVYASETLGMPRLLVCAAGRSWIRMCSVDRNGDGCRQLQMAVAGCAWLRSRDVGLV